MIKVIFRADGNSKTGLGHLYRLFALAETYKEQCDFFFLTKQDSLLDVIPHHYKVKTISNRINIEDEPFWIDSNFSHKEYIIIADGYQFDGTYQNKIKSLGFFLIYVDDLAKEYMYADIVVNHSPNIRETDFKAEKYTKFALGTSYAMLRPSFLKATKERRIINQINRTFVCFGGVDEFDLSFIVSKALMSFKNFSEINIVLGGAYKHVRIFELAEKNNIIKLHSNLSESSLFKLMKESDLAIAPCSTISYEICSVGIPLISGYIVENQLNIYKGFLEKNIFIDGGDLKYKIEEDFVQLIQELLDSTIEENRERVYNQFKLFNKNQINSLLTLI